MIPNSKTASISGLVSKSLESEIRTLILRKDIVVWLDASGAFTHFVDSLMELHLAGELPYAVKAFRGSHLQLMFAWTSSSEFLKTTSTALSIPLSSRPI